VNPLYIVIGVILLALIVLLVVYFILRKKKKKAEALAAESSETAAPGDDEIALLVREAENKLAAAKIEGAKAANLPVYLLAGDAAAAKTCVMLHSGLDAELVAGQVYQQGNVSSTRSANIWYSRRSLFVEASGRLFADAPKWKKLIQKLQPKGSVVGKGEQAPRAAVICFDCENFTKAGALEAAAAAARTLRARLGEVCQSFGIRLPVYAVFTKMDRLPFFNEYVRNLSNDEATQVLGVTLPMLGARPEGVYAEEETARLTGGFESLFRSLADARIEFLPRETDPSKLPAEYEFPREFRKVRQTVVQFLVDLCRPSQLTTGPFLRGFYFSGVRPIIINESAPVQAAASQPQANFGTAAGATGIFSIGSRQSAQAPQQPVVTGTRKVPQWLFLGHFFTDVLLADHSAMGASGSSVKTSGARRILFGAAAALCVLLTIFFTISFFKNRGLENQVSEASRAIGSGEAVGADFASVDSLRKLDTLRQSVETLSTYHREGAPLMYRWFLYIGDDLYPEARKVYFARFKQLLFAQAKSNDLAFLSGLPATPGPEFQPTYDGLKAYLITTSNHDKSTKAFLAPEMMKWWQNGRNADPERQRLAQKQFEFYSDELKDANPFTRDNDSGAIEKSRRYLAQFGGAKRLYAYMLSEAAKANPPIDYNKVFPGASQAVSEPRVVSGAFSKGGWGFMKDAMAHPDRYIGGDRWVLGDYATANTDPAKLEQDLKSMYYADFLDAWRGYIKSASVVKYASLKDASTKLNQLSGNQSPLLELFSLASTNTDVDDPTVKNSFQPVQTVVPPGSTDKFVAPPNQNYMQALVALQTSIEAIADQPGQPSDQAAAPAIASAQQATGTARQMAQAFRPDPEGHVDANSQRLLEEPIIYVLGMLRSLAPNEINAKGKDLCGKMRPLLAKYPFSPKAQAQATLAEIDSIFEPKKGEIWAFYDANLQKIVQRAGFQFAAASSGGMTVNPSFLAMLNRAGAFTAAAYQNGATDPQFTYSVKPVMSPDQDSVKMNIDGQSGTFTQSSQAAKPFVWPGQSSGTQASVSYKGTTHEYGFYPGLWSIFRFVQDANKRSGPLVEMTLESGQSRTPIIDQATGQPVTLKFEITANPPIFDPGYFSGMACIADVVK
jgi:type VI secretion system protein ImpL